VPLGAKNVQTADLHYVFVFRLDNAFGLLKFCLELFRRGIIGIDLLSFQVFARERLGIAAEQNICTAAGHVRRDRHRAFASCLCNDLGFALVILCIENIVGNVRFL